MLKTLSTTIVAASLLVALTGCDRPSQYASASSAPLPVPENDAGQPDIWPPGPGPEPVAAEGADPTVAIAPSGPPENDAGEPDIWPPGPGPEPAVDPQTATNE